MWFHIKFIKQTLFTSGNLALPFIIHTRESIRTDSVKMKTTKDEIATRGILTILICLFASIGTMAQVTCSRERIGSLKMIGSSEEYLTVQDSVQALAYDLYLISETYPDYRYVHQTNDAGIITAVSVVGISNVEVATKAATNLMLLEVLGEIVRTVDPVYLPKRSTVPGALSKHEAAVYKPAPPRLKEKKTVIVSNSML